MIKADWEKSHVTFVDPTIWPHYQKKAHDIRPVFHEMHSALEDLGVSCSILRHEDDPVDVWLRDWGPVEEGFFRYKPAYAIGITSPEKIKHARLKFRYRTGIVNEGQDVFNSSLILEGGNLIHNGKVAFCTDKVLKDNSSWTKEEIEYEIKSYLGFERVLFVPSEPGDDVAHTDGMMRFTTTSMLLLNDYSKLNPAYHKQLMDFFKSSHLSVNIVLYPYFVNPVKYDSVWSAEGCYVNFVMTSKGIVLPIYKNRMDEVALERLSKVTTLKIKPVYATPLARLGGVLNCVVTTN